jgi:hypothetical protein
MDCVLALSHQKKQDFGSVLEMDIMILPGGVHFSGSFHNLASAAEEICMY